MGSGYKMICPKCGFDFYSSTGVGMMFPRVYAETVRKAKNGELGKEIQAFFMEHPDGAINAESVSLCCEKCGHLTNGRDLTMYVPKAGKPNKLEHRSGSTAKPSDAERYKSRFELEDYYVEYKKYSHKCDKCGGSMRIMEEGEEFVCPECKVPLERGLQIVWD